jgi:hypothetical protein
MRESTEALSGNAPRAAMNISSASPSRIGAAVNAQQLHTVPERNMGRLADLLEQQFTRYAAIAGDVADDSAVATPNGLATTPRR